VNKIAHQLALPKTRRVSAALIALGAAVALLYYGRLFLITLSAAVILAFILDPCVVLLMRLRIPRALASFVVCSLAICGVYLLGLGIYSQAAQVIEDLPAYGQRINDLSDEAAGRMDAFEQWITKTLAPKRYREEQQRLQQLAAQQAKPVPRRRRTAEPVLPPAPVQPGVVQEVRIRRERPPLVDWLYGHLGSVYNTLLMASFVPFLVYFMLSWREHLQRSFLQLFDDHGRVVAARSLESIASVVRAFVVGNTLLGLLLAGATTLLLWLFRIPHSMLLGPLSGFLSLAPYIGLPLAMIPALVGMLAVFTKMAPYLIVLTAIAVLHLFALNLLYPKIVGPRVHLNPLVVTVALMFWSVVWGAAGLILAIPLTSGLKAVCDNVKQLEPYGRLLGD
jgi:predicted PurR-regulated permease PerM